MAIKAGATIVLEHGEFDTLAYDLFIAARDISDEEWNEAREMHYRHDYNFCDHCSFEADLVGRGALKEIEGVLFIHIEDELDTSEAS